MESREYQALAPSTATLKVEEVLARINQRPISFIGLLMDVVDACHKLELAKKHILYGKDPGIWARSNEDLSAEQLATPSQERFRQCFDLIHGAIGMATEAGELLQQVSEHVFHGEKLDQINVIEEAGDCFWYQALAAKGAGFTFEQAWAANIAKLRARYPAGVFDEKFCHNRDTEAERRAMDGTKPKSRVEQEAWAAAPTLRQHIETIEVGDRVRSARTLEPGGEYIEGTVVALGPDYLTLNRSTLTGIEATSPVDPEFLNVPGGWVMVKKARPFEHPGPGGVCSCPLCVPGKYATRVEPEVVAAAPLAQRKAFELLLISKHPGFRYVADGYGLFETSHWTAPSLGFIWVDFFQLNSTRRAQLKTKMSEDKRYHIGHLPLDPKAFQTLAGTKFCACPECQAPDPVEAQ